MRERGRGRERDRGGIHNKRATRDSVYEHQWERRDFKEGERERER